MRLARVGLVVLTGIAVAGVAGAPASDHAVWRARVVGVKLSGNLPEIRLATIVRWLMRDSPVCLDPLSEIPNVRASINNPLYGDEAAVAGAELSYAMDADAGWHLWSIRLGARIAAPPISYAVGGTQYISVLGGDSLFAFAPPGDSP